MTDAFCEQVVTVNCEREYHVLVGSAALKMYLLRQTIVNSLHYLSGVFQLRRDAIKKGHFSK